MSFSAPSDERWFEDYEPGSVNGFGAIRVAESEVLACGRRFDRSCSTQVEDAKGPNTAG